jgi:hypothetical protein
MREESMHDLSQHHGLVESPQRFFEPHDCGGALQPASLVNRQRKGV